MPLARKKRSKYEERLPPHILVELDHLRGHPPTAEEIRAATTMTEADLDKPETQKMLRDSGKGQVRVVFDLGLLDQMDWLIDDLTDAMVTELGGFTEDEEEQPDYEIFCKGGNLQQVVTLVNAMLYKHFEVQAWKAVPEPVTEGSYSEHQVRVMPQ